MEGFIYQQLSFQKENTARRHSEMIQNETHTNEISKASAYQLKFQSDYY